MHNPSFIPENLAPAGSRDALERAVAAGADAVYLGYSAFNARAGAVNFDEAALRDAIRFAHLHHVRVHVTLNTLIKDGELPAVLDTLRLLNDAGADAVLIQDLGVLQLARECFPALTVHASTQMAIHNAAGARFCAKEGVRRVVLARECSLSEIAKAVTEPIEVEVFGHGAQCVGVSGECLFSSMVGGRSGNRGRCAQPCRMQYTFRGKKGAWLSPRDVCLLPELPKLAEAGVASLKIEGRLKRPEYVAVTAGAYRRVLDGKPADESDLTGLKQMFSRGGFMRGYAFGAEDADVIDPLRVNHAGLKIGSVARVNGGMCRVKLTADLHDGDGLRFVDRAGDGECTYSGPEVPAGETAMIRLRPGLQVTVGDEVWRLSDAKQLADAAALPIPTIPVTLALTAYPGKPLTLTVSDGTSTVTVTGDEVSPAQNRALTPEDAARSLSKAGGTAFTVTACEAKTAGAFVPVSALNSLRRAGLDALTEARKAAFAPVRSEELPAPAVSLPTERCPDTVIFREPAQLEAIPAGARLVWYPEDFRADALEAGLAACPGGVWLQLPTVCEEATLEALHAFALQHADRLGGVVLGSVGQLGLDWQLPYAAGSGIPVMNRRALDFLLKRGCAFVTASAELTRAELETLCAGSPPVLIPACGRTQLMLLHHCPARTFLGLSKGHAACALCDKQTPGCLRGSVLTDRTGASFPLLRQRLPEGCIVRLMNSLPTSVSGTVCGCGRLSELTDETPDEAAALLRGQTGRVTAGHWKRGVE